MEEEIIRLLRNHDEEGLRLLQKKYESMLRYIVGTILYDAGEREECISDIYLKVWNGFPSYSEARGGLAAWLTAIARNTAVNRARRRKSVCVEMEEGTAVSPSPEETVLRQEKMGQLRGAIASLTGKEQHLFYRKYYYLQTTARIAAELGMTERAVEGKLYRLRNKLKKRLGGDFI